MPSSKQQKLLAGARPTTRSLDRATRRRGNGVDYHVVSVSLYTDQVTWLDREAKRLQEAGQPKAGRSTAVQALIDKARLHKSL